MTITVDLADLSRMIDNAVGVAMARARETGQWPAFGPPIEAMPAGPPTGYGQANALATPARAGLIAEVSEVRSIMFNRFEELDTQIVSVRNRVASLESHTFGDGPNAVSGR